MTLLPCSHWTVCFRGRAFGCQAKPKIPSFRFEFIAAGSLFGHLRDTVTKDMLSPMPTDLTTEALSMLESLMFAQVITIIMIHDP
jgi:hypothetical protein